MISRSQYRERTGQGILGISHSVTNCSFGKEQNRKFQWSHTHSIDSGPNRKFQICRTQSQTAIQAGNFRIPHSFTRWSFSIMRTKQSGIQPVDVRSKMVRCFHKRFGFRTKPLGDTPWHYERSTYSHVCVI